MLQLDDLDRSVLYELDRNSRRPFTEIAHALRQGRDKVEYRIKRLADAGIIHKYIASVDLFKLGYTMFKLYLRLENDRVRLGELIAHLKKQPQVFWIAYCDGSWDLAIAIFASSPREFHDFNTRLLSEFTTIILNFTAYTLVNAKYYGRNYLYAQSKRRLIESWGRPGDVQVDKTDVKILKILSENARASAIEIAERLNIGPHVVRYKIERLEKATLITGYRLVPDLNKLNVLLIKTQFFLRSYELAQRQMLADYCSKNPNIIAFLEQVGDCNLEIELEVNDTRKYYEIIDDIRSKFSKLIRNFQTIVIRGSHQCSVPGRIMREAAE